MRKLILPFLFLMGCDSSAMQVDAPPSQTEPAPDTAFSQPATSMGEATWSLMASRTDCVSPCSVMFSAENVGGDLNAAGYYWDYDDLASDLDFGTLDRGSTAHRVREGQAGVVEHSRNMDSGTYLGMHTYHCDQPVCTFTPAVSVMQDGIWTVASETISVEGQAAAFPGAATVCVSSSNDYTDCPAGAQHATQLPSRTSWQSGTRYLLRRGDTFNNTCMAYDNSDIMIDAYGSGAAPVLAGELGLGRDNSCGDAIPNPANLSTDYWLENVTVTNIRVPQISMGMTWRNVSIHNVDLDYGQELWGGRIRSKSADACSKREDLDCEDIPLPYGMYISDSVIIGSPLTFPGINVEFLSSTCVSFMGVYHTEMQRASGHNFRVECGSRVLAAHNDANGDHIGGRGSKNAITIRPEGHNTMDMLNQNKRTSIPKSNQYENKYIVVHGNYLGKDGIEDANAARITIAPTKNSDAESTYMGLVSDNYTDLPAHLLPSQDVQLAGRDLVCYDNNAYGTNNGCRDKGQHSIPSHLYEPADTNMVTPATPPAPSAF